MMDIKTDNSAVIATLNKRIENLERYNSGLANESCEQQARIAELEAIIRGRDELINNAESSRIAELEKERDQILKTALDSESNYCSLKDSMPVHNLEQQAKGVEDFVQPYFSYAQGFYGDGLRNAVELRNKAKALKDQGNG
jgi:hypothetical protein